MIVWKSSTVSPWRASFRYRVALPAMYLERMGVRSRIGWHPRLISLHNAEAIVFSKTFHAGDLALARRARERGIPIIYDLCDNVFVEGYPVRARTVLEQIAPLADLIVTTTAPLAEVAARNLACEAKIMVIPDSIERPMDTRAIMRRFYWAQRVEALHLILSQFSGLGSLKAVAKKVWSRPGHPMGCNPARHPASTHGDGNVGAAYANSSVSGIGPKRPAVVTWFGNHGGEFADFGMLDVLMVAPALQSLARRRPLVLRVISNSASKYRKHIASMKFPSEYVEWTPGNAQRLIQESDVVIVPSTLNDFTRCKSANRLLLALQSGVPVVATRTPATSEFEGCVVFDDWERGIENYLSDQDLRRGHLAVAAEVIGRRYTPEAISSQWADAIAAAKHHSGSAERRSGTAPLLVLLINLVQDLELILPIYQRAQQCSRWKTELWLTTHDLLKRPEMHKRLQVAGVRYKLVEPRYASRGGFPDWSGVAALISASESTADPHVQAHVTVKYARRRGVRTYTIQHGFQNVGLTYGDERFPIDRVGFASDVIFLWGTLDSLDRRVAVETREKCVPVGCPKSLQYSGRELPVKTDKPRVAIFENLHSARYNDTYREAFLRDLQAVTSARPDLSFIIKPHPAGQWLTARYRGKLELSENVIIADPKDPDWVDVSAADILSCSTAAITSVTTVAFDAARLGKPIAVAVSGYARDLASFSPLTLLRTQDDWNRYLRSAVDLRDPAIGNLSRHFAQKAMLAGDAVQRILDFVENEMDARRLETPLASV